ncbi:hypothetical protein TRVA0_002S04170 [Trichomonascus vanleenenianus]|uniref:uncharacterized protein n=1 Tax=Trichomonascus vanleenenianus TaxID=2268995 RepID=UPI003ECB451B
MARYIEDFFVQDARNSAPSAAILPDSKDIVSSKLWSGLLVTYSNSDLTYASMSRPNVVYRVPLSTRRESARRRLLHARIVNRLNTLMVWGCIERVVWRFLYPPPSSMNNSALQFMASIFSSLTVQSLELDIPDLAGNFFIFMMKVGLEFLTDLAQMKLTLRHGDFSSNEFA